MSEMPLLSFAIWVPIFAGLVVLLTGSDRNAPLARGLALLGAIAGLVVTLPLYTGFDVTTPAMQFVEMAPWIPRFNINYHLGVDGISVLFVILNSFITLVVVLAGWEVIKQKIAQYNAAFLIMSGLLNGIFASLDGLLFYIFFEASLIPLYLIIGVWGGPRRVYAAFKFFLFTLLGSLLFLVSLIYLFVNSGGSFSILDWHQLPIPMPHQSWIFLAFLVAFAVKVPMWPVHTWLPDAHVEAPTGGSIVLAAIALKLGAYGFLRFSLPIAPDASHEYSGLIIALSLIAVVYIGFVALVQEDMKKLVAYSSIAHMGFVTLGFFMLTPLAVEGAIVQMISHGFVSGASTHNQRLQAMREVYREYREIIDPHTADGVFVAYQYLDDGVPMVVLETAQPAKFEDTIKEALNIIAPRPDATRDIESLPQRVFNLPNNVDAIKQFIREQA